MGNLKFGDVYTKDLDLIIQAPPVYNFPAKDLSTEHIPGRNGDLIIDNKCWQNVERTYSIAAVFRPNSNFIENCEKFIKFLTAKRGYQRLEDSYDPKVFRMAQFKSNGALQNYYDEATAMNVTFDCKPQRYLKDGEVPVLFSGASATLENPTGRPALPIIAINGITHVDNQVLLVTVRNNSKVTSSITISDVPSGDVIIDSELQTVSSETNGDINEYVGLNDTQFPVLDEGDSEVEINKYTEQTTVVEKYDIVMTNNKQTCLALYKPYDAIVESKQKTFSIKSYNLLKQQVQEVYEADTYANYCLSYAQKNNGNYTFISFNTVMSATSQTYSFQSDYSSAPSWLQFSRSNGKIIVTVGDLSSFDDQDADISTSMAYFISSSDKVVRRLQTGCKIGEFAESSTVTITVYPAHKTTGNLKVDYSEYDMPSWLAFEITYDKTYSDAVSGQSNVWILKSISYKTNAAGYYYLPKSGLFGKAGWATLSSGTVITTLDWSSYKKAFMPSGISTSTTASFEYYYLASAPQYETIYIDKVDENGNVVKDANGNPVKEPSNVVHFRVVALDATLTSIKYTAIEAGYYRCNDGNQGSAWKYLAANADIPASCGFVNTVKAPNIVYYMASLPTYDKVEGFPDWLDPNPVLSGSDVANGNPTTIELKVKEANWFRCTYISGDEELFNSWTYLQVDATLGSIGNSHGPDDSYSAYMIEGAAGTFPIKTYTYTDSDGHTINDIGFFYLDSEGHQIEYQDNQPPAWLKVDVIPGVNEDGSDTTLEFKANAAGSYNWDANTVWINKQVGGELVTSTNKDDTTVNYLSSTPSYPTTYPLFNITVNKNAVTGNPETISFTVKSGKAGYFRAKNSSNWKFYEEGEEICNSKVSETTTIYNLQASGSLTGLEITITPRWWNL